MPGDGPDGVRLGARRQHRIGDRNVALVDADVPVLDEVAHRPADERVRRCAQGVDVAADESAPGDAVDVEEDEIGGGTRRPAEVARPSQREWRPLLVVQLQVPRTVATAAPDFAGKTRFRPDVDDDDVVRGSRLALERRQCASQVPVPARGDDHDGDAH